MGIFDAISLITKKSVEKRTLLANLDAVYLAMDEVCDSGIIIESDPETIFSRSSSKQDDLPLGDQTVADVLQKAKEQIRLSVSMFSISGISWFRKSAKGLLHRSHGRCFSRWRTYSLKEPDLSSFI